MIISTRSFSSCPHVITHIENRCQLKCINCKYIKTWVWQDLQSDEIMKNFFFWDMISSTMKNFEVTCMWKWITASVTDEGIKNRLLIIKHYTPQVTKGGKIIDEKTYRLNMAKKEHRKHVRDLLATAIVHKTLDLEVRICIYIYVALSLVFLFFFTL